MKGWLRPMLRIRPQPSMGHSLGPGKTSPVGGGPPGSPVPEESGRAHRRSSTALPIYVQRD